MSNLHAVDDQDRELDDADEVIDDEVAAIAVIVDALGVLEPDAQARVLTWAIARYQA